MSTAQTIDTPVDFNTLVRLPIRLTDEQFFEFCMLNRNLRIERLANRNITIMSPTTSLTGRWNARLSGLLFNWNETYALGEVFDSSSGFTMLSGAILSPDASWILQERWLALPKSEQNKFATICPDFILELRSSSDNIQDLREKMEEYIRNGCRLAWLVDPLQRKTMVYRQDGSVQVVAFDQKLEGDEVLPGFGLVMGDVITD
jgi:Uma2 family endonuclease